MEVAASVTTEDTAAATVDVDVDAADDDNDADDADDAADDDGGNVVQLTQASSQRASRAARPSEPSPFVQERSLRIVAEKEAELVARGLVRVGPDELQRFKLPTASTGKGPAVDANGGKEDQALMNHMVTVKSRSIKSNSSDPPWLTGDNEAPKMYTRLVQDAIRANAVNSVIVGRAPTQGAANQYACISNSGAPLPTRLATSLPAPWLLPRGQCGCTAACSA